MVIVQRLAHLYGEGLTRTYAYRVNYSHIGVQVVINQKAQVVVHRRYLYSCAKLGGVGIEGGVRIPVG